MAKSRNQLFMESVLLQTYLLRSASPTITGLERRVIRTPSGGTQRLHGLWPKLEERFNFGRGNGAVGSRAWPPRRCTVVRSQVWFQKLWFWMTLRFLFPRTITQMIKNVVTVTKFTLGITKGFKPYVFVSHKINLKLRIRMLCTYIHTIPVWMKGNI